MRNCLFSRNFAKHIRDPDWISSSLTHLKFRSNKIILRYNIFFSHCNLKKGSFYTLDENIPFLVKYSKLPPLLKDIIIWVQSPDSFFPLLSQFLIIGATIYKCCMQLCHGSHYYTLFITWFIWFSFTLWCQSSLRTKVPNVIYTHYFYFLHILYTDSKVKFSTCVTVCTILLIKAQVSRSTLISCRGRGLHDTKGFTFLSRLTKSSLAAW